MKRPDDCCTRHLRPGLSACRSPGLTDLRTDRPLPKNLAESAEVAEVTAVVA
jgi:hypothetical protein